MNTVMLQRFKYTGKAVLPKRVYMGNTYNIPIDLQQEYDIDPARGRYLETENAGIDKVGKQDLQPVKVTLQVSGTYLEAELLASGFATYGVRTQRQRLSAPHIEFVWSCMLIKSGVHDCTILLRTVTVDEGKETIEPLGRIEQSTRVVQLGNLTRRQLDYVT
jgi:hypothetical protein